MGKQDTIKDIVSYEYTRDGGYITVKFESGWITRRRFRNIVYDYPRKDALSGKEIPAGQTGIYFQIKKRGYTRYWISQTTINSALAGDYKSIQEDDKTPLVKEIMNFLDDCKNEKIQLDKEDRNLRAALREIKFKGSKLGKKMSAAHQLLELVTEK